jgi:hypothetical protein
MRDIQNKLILYWSNSNKISDLIKELPTFCDTYEKQVKEGILPNVGTYYLSPYIYDINDFFQNNNNICFKIKIPYTKETELLLKDSYLVITSSNLLILEPADNNSKNLCVIDYYGDLFAVEKIEEIEGNDKSLEEYYTFKIIWNKHINNKYNKIMCAEKQDYIKKDINDFILVRRDIIKNNFQFFEKSDNMDVDDYKLIIAIKKKIIEKVPNEIIYAEINKCYRKIIELLSNYEDENIQEYIDELHKFIEEYEKKFKKNK